MAANRARPKQQAMLMAHAIHAARPGKVMELIVFVAACQKTVCAGHGWR